MADEMRYTKQKSMKELSPSKNTESMHMHESYLSRDVNSNLANRQSELIREKEDSDFLSPIEERNKDHQEFAFMQKTNPFYEAKFSNPNMPSYSAGNFRQTKTKPLSFTYQH